MPRIYNERVKANYSVFHGFQWDGGNQDKNQRKQNVSQTECEEFFFNAPLLIANDEKHSDMEKRWVAFGATNEGRLLTIIFTKRDKLIRVISARDMHRKERELYKKS
jgi:uncharacterized DUF497 family protein